MTQAQSESKMEHHDGIIVIQKLTPSDEVKGPQEDLQSIWWWWWGNYRKCSVVAEIKFVLKHQADFFE